jgi:hypothetical protein
MTNNFESNVEIRFTLDCDTNLTDHEKNHRAGKTRVKAGTSTSRKTIIRSQIFHLHFPRWPQNSGGLNTVVVEVVINLLATRCLAVPPRRVKSIQYQFWTDVSETSEARTCIWHLVKTGFGSVAWTASQPIRV